MIKLDRLITWLNQTTLQSTNNPLYQVILTLIKAAQEFQAEQDAINTSSGGAIVNIQDADFLTWSDESVLLPSSRQLLPGTNVSFDDSVANQRTVNIAGAATGTDYVVMSDGATPPSPMDDGNGNFIYITYTPP